jgi:hypothetical protein
MNYVALSLAVIFSLLPVFVALVTYLIFQIHHTQELIMSFRTDADTAIGNALTAINNIPSRIPPAVDPATVVSVEDQSAVLSGIGGLQSAADAILPKTA